MLCDLGTPELQEELEVYRLEYEKEHGPTDLSRHYTSTMPVHLQNWLLEHHPLHYWKGLPPFVQGYLRGKLTSAAIEGSLDDMPEAFVRLFMARQIAPDGHHR